MKKLFSVFALLLALCCLVSCGKGGNNAAYEEAEIPEGSLALYVSDVSAKPGEKVTVTVTLAHNLGINGFSFCLVPPDDFPVSDEKIVMVDDAYSFVKRLSGDQGKGINFAWTSLTACKDDRVIAQMDVTVPEGTAPGAYEVRLDFRPNYDCFYPIAEDNSMPNYDVVPFHGIITVE